MRLFVLARHAHSTLNFEGRVNGDPSVPVAAHARGPGEARAAGRRSCAHVPLDLCVHTRFGRTLETAELALRGRDVPLELTSRCSTTSTSASSRATTIEEYRAWKREHHRSDPFPGGESLDDAARRYAKAFRKLLRREETSILVVTHEIPVRYALNAAAGSNDLDGPAHQLANATPYIFDKESLTKARRRDRGPGGPVIPAANGGFAAVRRYGSPPGDEADGNHHVSAKAETDFHRRCGREDLNL